MDCETTEDMSYNIVDQQIFPSSSTLPGATGCIDSTHVKWGPSTKIPSNFNKNKESNCLSGTFEMRFHILIQKNDSGVHLLMEK